MSLIKRRFVVPAFLCTTLWVSTAAQEMPSDYKGVLTTLGKTGELKEGVLKVNVPRNDLQVTIRQRPAPTPSASADGWPSRKRPTAARS